MHGQPNIKINVNMPAHFMFSYK